MEVAPFRPSIGIIGGRGRMGRWLERRLRHSGHAVSIADLSEGPLGAGFVQACQVLILAVPVAAVEKVMAAIGPLTRPEHLVMDIASLKAGPLASMLAHAKGEVIGTHPLFGPATRSLAGQLVFVCPGRGSRWLGWLMNLLKEGRMQVVQMEAERHDRLMAQVQTLRHLLLVGLGRALMRLGFDPAQDLERSGPWFQGIMGMLAHQLRQPPELYADLALHNPAGPEAMRVLGQSLAEVTGCLASGDRGGLVRLMEEVGSFLRGDKLGPGLDAAPHLVYKTGDAS
ncbi:MAG: prephenate dehydrogenase/arogenate dehydrogenase family protein [Desulfarculus sp.]|nr:MAG: prephenate dehydrogenase/arogenate dehydrogenase family protein [Desulfarculus sp.]